MKKIFFVAPAALILALGIWFWFGRETALAPEVVTTNTDNPFGSGEGVNIPSIPSLSDGQPAIGVSTPFDTIATEAKLFRISNAPVAGFAITVKGTEVSVRYVDRATGNIFDTSLSSGEKKRLTNNTLPKIYEAYFKPDGLAVLLRSLEGDSDVVKNLSLALAAPKSSSTDGLYAVTATNLRGDIESVTVLGNSLVYVAKNNNSILSTNFSGGEQKNLLATMFSEWRTAKFGNNVLLYPKASFQAAGAAYSLIGGSLTRLAGPLNGLTAVANSNAARILYSYSENGAAKMAVKNLSKGSVSEILPASLAEKCAWSPKRVNVFYCGTPLNGIGQSEPDNWYLGRSHYTDYVWEFDTDSEIAQLVSEPKTDFGIDIDVYQPAISPNEDFLVFLNKRDLTLWAIRLK